MAGTADRDLLMLCRGVLLSLDESPTAEERQRQLPVETSHLTTDPLSVPTPMPFSKVNFAEAPMAHACKAFSRHAAISQAIGILCLGEGCLSFKDTHTNVAAIAAILLAIYPYPLAGPTLYLTCSCCYSDTIPPCRQSSSATHRSLQYYRYRHTAHKPFLAVASENRLLRIVTVQQVKQQSKQQSADTNKCDVEKQTKLPFLYFKDINSKSGLASFQIGIQTIKDVKPQQILLHESKSPSCCINNQPDCKMCSNKEFTKNIFPKYFEEKSDVNLIKTQKLEAACKIHRRRDDESGENVDDFTNVETLKDEVLNTTWHTPPVLLPHYHKIEKIVVRYFGTKMFSTCPENEEACEDIFPVEIASEENKFKQRLLRYFSPGCEYDDMPSSNYSKVIFVQMKKHGNSSSHWIHD